MPVFVPFPWLQHMCIGAAWSSTPCSLLLYVIGNSRPACEQHECCCLLYESNSQHCAALFKIPCLSTVLLYCGSCVGRERQRTMMQSMEAEVADKLAQLQLLTAENDMLQLRSAVLESTTSIAEGMVR